MYKINGPYQFIIRYSMCIFNDIIAVPYPFIELGYVRLNWRAVTPYIDQLLLSNAK